MHTEVASRDVVVLVDRAGAPEGEAAKLDAHVAPGRLHLAFSVLLYREDGRTLLQQRAATKYHFPLHWANACCSHPGPGEDVLASAERRVREELGVGAALESAGTFTYRATCPVSGLVEHEFDHVLIGRLEGEPDPALGEVAALEWVDPAQVLAGRRSGLLAPWLVPALRLGERARAGATGR